MITAEKTIFKPTNEQLKELRFTRFHWGTWGCPEGVEYDEKTELWSIGWGNHKKLIWPETLDDLTVAMRIMVPPPLKLE